MKKILLVFISCLSFACVNAQANEIKIKNDSLSYNLPTGFCEVKPDKAKSSEIFNFFDKSLGKSVELHTIIAPCKEIAEVSSGRADALNSVILLSSIGIDGKFVKFRFGRRAYLNFMTLFKPDKLDKTMKRANDRLKPYNVKIANLMISDPYVKNQMVNYTGNISFEYKEKKAGFDFLASSTLAKSWPIATAVLYRNDKDIDLKKILGAYSSITEDLKKN